MTLEREVQQSIESMDREYGIIVVTNRLSTVENADRIYALKDGDITERGTHRELIDNQGKNAELYEL